MPDPKEQTDEELWDSFKEEDAAFAEKQEGANDVPVEAAAEQPPTPEPDIWANAPPDLKAAHDGQVKALESAQTEHARRSIEGRIAAYTRRLQERNEAAKAAKPAPEEEAADPFEELAADYPEIAQPLQKKLAPITEKISQFESEMRSRQEAADRQMDTELQANERLLEQQHPGWDKYLHDHGPAFGAWIVDQPLALRQAFITNQEAIIDPYSAIDTLSAFKAFVEQNTQPPQAQPAAQQNRLNPRRAAQLAGSASPHSVGTRPTVSGIPQDADEQTLWNAWAAVDPDEQKYRRA
jgi:hypothetical protein